MFILFVLVLEGKAIHKNVLALPIFRGKQDEPTYINLPDFLNNSKKLHVTFHVICAIFETKTRLFSV